MVRKSLIALLAVAALGLISPTMALARGGGGGHGGGGFGGGGFRGGGFAGGYQNGGFGRGFHGGYGHRFAFGSGPGYGYYPYDYYDYSYDPYADYDNGSCYVVQQRVHTSHGWRGQPVQVCG
jgi:hypothetical protein